MSTFGFITPCTLGCLVGFTQTGGARNEMNRLYNLFKPTVSPFPGEGELSLKDC